MKKFTGFIFILSIILVFNTFAQDSRWRKLTGSGILYDTKTLKKTNNRVSVWIKYLAKDKSYKLVLNELDCDNVRIRTNDYISYNSEGNVINSSSTTTSWDVIIPESNGEAYYDILCKDQWDLQSLEDYLGISDDLGSKDKVLYVSAKKANLRKLPSLNSEIVTVLPEDSKLFVKKEEGDWYLVSINKIKGWIHNSTVSNSLENSKQETPVKYDCENENAVKLKFDKTQFFQSPSGATLMVLPKGRLLTLLSQKSHNGYSWVKDNKTNLDGYVLSNSLEKDCSLSIRNPIVRIPKTTTKPPTDNDSFQAEYTGRDEKPFISIINSTNKTMTLLFGGVKYTIPSNKTQQITVEGGNYEFTVSATGVRSLSGVKTFNRGYGYTWTFTIVTTRY